MKCDDAPEEAPSVTTEKVLKIACNISITTNYMHTGILDVSNLHIVSYNRKELIKALQALDEKIEKISPTLGRDATYTAHSRLSRLPSYLTVHMVRFAWRSDIGKKAKILRKVKFPTEFDAIDLVTDELKQKLLPVSRKLKAIDKEREERRKVRKRTKVIQETKTDADVEMADAAAPAAGSSSGATDQPAASDEGKGKEVAGGDLLDETVYREKEQKELEALIDPSLKADTGSSVSGLYDLVGELSRCRFFNMCEILTSMGIAIVTHKGAAADAGHYMAYVKKSVFYPQSVGSSEGSAKLSTLSEDDEDWYKFDDSKVSIFPKEKLESIAGGGQDSAAYVLLYKAKSL